MGDTSFFDMISDFQSGDGRMEEQRSAAPIIEKPMVYDTELDKAKEIGVENVVENYETYKGEYIGNAPCFYGNDKETICHQVVFAHYKDKKKVNYSPMVARLNEKGITFIIGKSGGASVSIELRDVACCALCPTKPTQLKKLKVVAILARSAGGRRSSQGQKQVGELDLICHMFKLRDEPAMWYFQQQFVHSLNVAFPAKQKKDSTIGRQYNSSGNVDVGDKPSRRGSASQRPSAIGEEDEDEAEAFPSSTRRRSSAGGGGSGGSGGSGYQGEMELPATTGKYYVGAPEVVKLTPYVAPMKVFVKPSAAGQLENDREMAQQMEEAEQERQLQLRRRELEDAAYARRLQQNEAIPSSIAGPMDGPSWNPFDADSSPVKEESARSSQIKSTIQQSNASATDYIPEVKDAVSFPRATAADVDFSDDDGLDGLDLGN